VLFINWERKGNWRN